MKILLTGATAFIGQRRLSSLKKEGHEVYALVRPSSDYKELNHDKFLLDDGKILLSEEFKRLQIEGVIHLATCFLVAHKESDLSNLITANVLLGSRLLEASVLSNVKWFLNTGTFWQHYQGEQYSPVNFYAATKEALDTISKYYIEAFGLNYCTLKINDTYGPGDTRRKIMNVWRDISQTGETIEMGPGLQLMDMVFIDDVLSGFIRMIEVLNNDKEKSCRGKSFALACSKRMTLKDLASVFEKVSEKKLNIKWGAKDYRPREVMIPWNQFELVPGWKAQVSFEEGIKKLLS